MDDVALEAEISKPTIYKYYRSKESLFFALMQPVFDELEKYLKKIENDVKEELYTSGKPFIYDLFQALTFPPLNIFTN